MIFRASAVPLIFGTVNPVVPLSIPRDKGLETSHTEQVSNGGSIDLWTGIGDGEINLGKKVTDIVMRKNHRKKPQLK